MVCFKAALFLALEERRDARRVLGCVQPCRIAMLLTSRAAAIHAAPSGEIAPMLLRLDAVGDRS
jgi:hypothetical protein